MVANVGDSRAVLSRNSQGASGAMAASPVSDLQCSSCLLGKAGATVQWVSLVPLNVAFLLYVNQALGSCSHSLSTILTRLPDNLR